KPIIFVYPYSLGTAADGPMRLAFNEAGKAINGTFVIDSRPGANGRLGMIALQNNRTDPYLLSYASHRLVVNDALRDPAFRIRPYVDYTPIISMYGGGFVAVMSPSAPFKDLKGFIAYAKANPGKANVAISGLAGPPHIGVLLLAETEGLRVTTIP